MASPPSLTREAVARREIGHTDLSPRVAWWLTTLFGTVIAGVPLVDVVGFSHAGQPGLLSRLATLLSPTAESASQVSSAGPVASLRAANSRLRQRIKHFETGLLTDSATVHWLLPRLEGPLTRWLPGSHSSACLGRDGSLYYRPDLAHLLGHPFLDPVELAARSTPSGDLEPSPQPDPRLAIRDFQQQLASRGITLVILPVPSRGAIDPEPLTRRGAQLVPPVQNASFPPFLESLRQMGVVVCDPAPLLASARREDPSQPLFLQTDTHWTPRSVERVADELARVLRRSVPLAPAEPSRFALVEHSVSNQGDIARMIPTLNSAPLFAPEQVTLRSVTFAGQPWRPSASAEVLLLGDSFANIYSQPELQWGAGAGLAEHLSAALGLPVDTLLRNDRGACATREALARQLALGDDRLAGKRVVVWEFACRELSQGDWKLIPLQPGSGPTGDFYVPAPGRNVLVEGRLQDASSVPSPGSGPYRDHIRMLHLTELRSPEDHAAIGREAVVLAWSLRDRQPTPVAHWQPGQRVQLRLFPWSERLASLEPIQRSELPDPRFSTGAWSWGEPAAAVSNSPGPTADVSPDPVRSPPPTVMRETSPTAPPTAPSVTEGDRVGRCRALCARLADEPGDNPIAIAREAGWWFLRSELRHLSVGPFWGPDAGRVSRARQPQHADPLPAILDFHTQLQQRGVELIFVPVPAKGAVHSAPLGLDCPTELGQPIPEFLTQLTAAGVRVVDLSEVFRREGERPDTPLLYCRTDSHWSPWGCEVVARELRERLGTPSWLVSHHELYPTTDGTREILGDLLPPRGAGPQEDPRRQPEQVPVRVIQPVEGAVVSDRSSPILLLGDSHVLVYHAGQPDLHGAGAGLADQLAHELGRSIDVLGVRGSGSTAARSALLQRQRSDPGYLAGKKVLIWVVTAREFTESTTGWVPLPLR